MKPVLVAKVMITGSVCLSNMAKTHTDPSSPFNSYREQHSPSTPLSQIETTADLDGALKSSQVAEVLITGVSVLVIWQKRTQTLLLPSTHTPSISPVSDRNNSRCEGGGGGGGEIKEGFE